MTLVFTCVSTCSGKSQEFLKSPIFTFTLIRSYV